MPSRSAERHRYAYLPFGGGARFCIGSNFAMMEGTLLLATIAQACRLQLVPGFKVIHTQDVDFRTTCSTLKGCLTTIRDWSRANPWHVPIMVMIAVRA